ncbi:MAG: outer membrane protein transport protein [Pseudomonadota bacterium]|nr:outer membrane protein transport protein [Pseudomonadota bacterium]
MKRILISTLTSAAVAAVLLSPLAHATNGYFKIGAGAKNKGLAGAGIAYGQDGLAGASNPATLAGIGTRIDGGLEIFKPKRRGVVDARSIGGARSEEKSRSNTYLIPQFGTAKVINDKITLGLAVTANGGMNTRYGDADAGNGNIYTDAFGPAIPGFVPLVAGQLVLQGIAPDLPTALAIVGANAATLAQNPNITPALGINLAQALITPTITYKFSDNHAVGFGPVIGWQRFRAYGLGLFQAFSDRPDKVTNNGNDNSVGYGARIGYQGTFFDMFSVGAVATSKIYMDKFDDYAGLFAEQGDFDIPATFGGGIAVHFTPRLTVAADVSRIMYSDVDSLANNGPTADEFFAAFGNALATANGSLLPNALGKNDGWGFGWDDVWVYKIGVDYAYTNKWTFRAGFNYAEVPFDDDQALFNVLAPAVVEKHVTAGFTYSPSQNSEISVAYMHAFRNDVDNTYTGSGNFAGFSYGAKNDMYQNSIEASYAWKF